MKVYLNALPSSRQNCWFIFLSKQHRITVQNFTNSATVARTEVTQPCCLRISSAIYYAMDSYAKLPWPCPSRHVSKFTIDCLGQLSQGHLTSGSNVGRATCRLGQNSWPESWVMCRLVTCRPGHNSCSLRELSNGVFTYRWSLLGRK